MNCVEPKSSTSSNLFSLIYFCDHRFSSVKFRGTNFQGPFIFGLNCMYAYCARKGPYSLRSEPRSISYACASGAEIQFHRRAGPIELSPSSLWRSIIRCHRSIDGATSTLHSNTNVVSLHRRGLSRLVDAFHSSTLFR